MADIVKVPANRMWVETPVWVQAGDTLYFRADGAWVDAVIPCSANGYPASVFYALGRPPRIPDKGRYFRLMGRIVPRGTEPADDDPDATFPIGARSEHPPTQSGRLFVFANDRIGYYWNNWGSVRLSISKEYLRCHIQV